VPKLPLRWRTWWPDSGERWKQEPEFPAAAVGQGY